MDDAIRDLSADAIIRAGGWHPSYARVLLIEDNEDDALVLVDGNGDGAELELEYWHRDTDSSWRGGSTSGHGSLDFMPSSESWDAGEFVAALGRVAPATEVTVEYGGHAYHRTANEFGVWGLIHAADSARPGELPKVTVAARDAGTEGCSGQGDR
jgi:hypothetical protein